MIGLTLAPPLAHLGHWYVSLPVFMGPVVVLALALKAQTWREAHKGPDRTGKRSTVSSSTAGRTDSSAEGATPSAECVESSAGHAIAKVELAGTSAERTATVAVGGPLDYPALLEIEVELGRLVPQANELVLDLRRLTTADEDGAAGLCDAIAGAHAMEKVAVLLPQASWASGLSAELACEGIRLGGIPACPVSVKPGIDLDRAPARRR